MSEDGFPFVVHITKPLFLLVHKFGQDVLSMSDVRMTRKVTLIDAELPLFDS